MKEAVALFQRWSRAGRMVGRYERSTAGGKKLRGDRGRQRCSHKIASLSHKLERKKRVSPYSRNCGGGKKNLTRNGLALWAEPGKGKKGGELQNRADAWGKNKKRHKPASVT